MSETGTGAPSSPLLELQSCVVRYGGRTKAPAVRELSLHVNEGETLGLAGASGAGKTTVARLALGLVLPSEGRVCLRGRRWNEMSRRERRSMRRSVQAVFQHPNASLNPRMTVYRIVSEPLVVHKVVSGRHLKSVVEDLLDSVELGSWALDKYPHELSGGQQQRVAIARAISLDPDLVVLDEPVSALDMSVRSRLIGLLTELQARTNVAYLHISHDLRLLEKVADRIAVMQDGEIVETGAIANGGYEPKTSYGQDLYRALELGDVTRAKSESLANLYT